MIKFSPSITDTVTVVESVYSGVFFCIRDTVGRQINILPPPPSADFSCLVVHQLFITA